MATDWIGDGVKDQPRVGGSFKEQIAADLDIFLNPDEFGEYAIVDGVSMCVVMSQDKRDTNTIDGIISYDAVIMHAREDDLRRLARCVSCARSPVLDRPQPAARQGKDRRIIRTGSSGRFHDRRHGE